MRAPWWLWVGGAAMSLVGYFWSAIPIPRRTPVGVERRLFGLELFDPRLQESPSGGQWLLVREGGDAEYMPASGPFRPPAAPSSFPAAILRERLQSLHWPGSPVAPRTFSLPLNPPGSWEIEGSSVRRVWSRDAAGWLDDHHLWAGRADDWRTPEWVFDLRAGRAAPGESPNVEVERQQTEQAPEEDDCDDPSTLGSALEELPADLSGDWEHLRVTSRGAVTYLVYTRDPAGEPRTLYAVSDDPAPRILRLAGRALPLALSRDGRTLYFERREALWRLDMRLPLTALLAEVPVPELPSSVSGR